MLPPVKYKDNQAKADGAVEILWKKISAAKLDAADIVVVVRSEVLEIVHDTFGMSSIARQNIKSASQGQRRPSCFVLCAKHPETNVFFYHVFCTEDPMLVSGSLQLDVNVRRAFHDTSLTFPQFNHFFVLRRGQASKPLLGLSGRRMPKSRC